jgi:hypothetical protein
MQSGLRVVLWAFGSFGTKWNVLHVWNAGRFQGFWEFRDTFGELAMGSFGTNCDVFRGTCSRQVSEGSGVLELVR